LLDGAVDVSLLDGVTVGSLVFVTVGIIDGYLDGPRVGEIELSSLDGAADMSLLDGATLGSLVFGKVGIIDGYLDGF